MSERASTAQDDNRYSRRQFLGALGSGVVATAGVSGSASAQGIPTISMGNNYFDPVGLAIEAGTTVRFEIDEGSHSATAYEDRIPSDAAPFDSETISQGEFEHTFEIPGTYDYYCIPHESMGMTGRIVVDEPGGPAEGSPLSEGDVPTSNEIVAQGRISIDGSGTSDRDGMMQPRPHMMDGNDIGWKMLAPVGMFTTAIGVAGGIGYWLSRQ